MKVVLDKDLPIKENLACSIGNFDGFHAGHIKVLNTLKDVAKEKNLKTVVITFKPHPREVIKKENICKIINFETKKEFLKNLGIDFLVVLNFNKTFSNLNREEFLRFLKEKINCKALVVGEDWKFGKNRKGNIDFVKEFGDIEIYPVKKELKGDEKISSSYIRKLLEKGNIKQVNKLLKRNYCLVGKIVQGNKIGTKIGFPTINVKFEENLCLKHGVYVGFVEINGRIYKAVMNFGIRPTVDGSNEVLEIHVLDKFDGDIKQEYIKVYFIDFLRPELKFNNLDTLKNQIEKDIDVAKKKLKEVGNEVNI